MATPTVPHHLAIIPDGNRRWAKAHGLTSSDNLYDQGGERISEVLEAAFNLNVRCVSLWIGSYSNLTSRNVVQVKILERLYEEKFTQLATDPFIFRNRIKIEAYGEWATMLQPSVAAAVQHAIDITEAHDNGTLVILIGYDGKRERGAALQSLARSSASLPADFTKTDDLLQQHSWTGHLPNVDLLIRTGAWEDPHNSGSFLSFLMGDTQFAFPPELWPDYTADMLAQELDNFSQRERRLGK